MSNPHPGLRTLVVLPFALCAGLLLLCSCDRGDAVESGPEKLVPSVEAVQARQGALPLTQRLSGVVKARNQIAIYPEVNAIITEVLVENGEAVRKGQALVRLRDREFHQRLKQAEANHRITAAQMKRAEALANEARMEFERLRSLAETDLVSQAELEGAQARTESADADVELAKARMEQSQAGAEELEENLSRTVIEASIAGRVGNRNAEVGMLANPGTRLFTLGQLDSVQVEIVLTDRMLDHIETGQRVAVSTGRTSASAPLSRISPFLNPVSHSTEAEIDLANPDGHLKPGMFVTVDVFYGESEEATLVPLSALYENPDTGVIGVYVTRESLEPAPEDEAGDSRPQPLTSPVSFEFVPAELIAQGRLEAAIRGVDQGAWVVTLGQNLLGGENAQARVRPVKWERVERLQTLQREDLMQDVIERQATW